MRRSQRESCDIASISCSKLYKNKTQLCAETCTRTSIIAQFRSLYGFYVVDNWSWFNIAAHKKFINHFLKQKKRLEVKQQKHSHTNMWVNTRLWFNHCRFLLRSRVFRLFRGSAAFWTLRETFNFVYLVAFVLLAAPIADRRSSLQEKNPRRKRSKPSSSPS